MPRISTVLLLLLLLSPTVAVADSDGYYCAGRGYVAYETRLSTPASKHLLHVVQFSGRQGIVKGPPIVLEDFQVHGMKCRPTVIEVVGWTTRYSVDIADLSHPVIKAEAVAFDPKASESLNLGHWSKEVVIDLEGDALSGEFQLVVSRVSRRRTGGIEHYTISQVIRRQTEPGGRIVDSLDLFEGIFLETVD
jgi:hypothetical protein